MASCKNRGKFPGKKGRPSKAALAELEERKLFPETTAGQLKKMAAADVRDTGRNSAASFRNLLLPDNLPMEEWLAALIVQSGNPFVFEQDGYLFKLGGCEYLRS